MSLPTDLKIPTKDQLNILLLRKASDLETQAMVSLATAGFELAMGALIEIGNPISVTGAAASIGTLLTTVLGEAGDEVGLALNIIQMAMAIEDRVNSKIQWALDELEDQKREQPDSLLFDALRWNRIIGMALNYGYPDFSVIKAVPESFSGAGDWYFDFKKVLGYKTTDNKQRYLSQEFEYLLNCRMEGY